MAVKLKKNAAIGSLSVTPLIDVVFLLLIFFLVATRFSKQENELDLDLPTASEALPITVRPTELFINIDKEGQYYIQGKFRQVEELEHILRQAAINNPQTQTVVIRADQTTDWQAVATAFDLCKKVGIYQYTAMTEGQ